MIFETKNNKQVILRKLNSKDFDNLFDYLQKLSRDTKRRFGPHPFDKQSIIDFYENAEIHLGYIAISFDTKEIVAYSIIKMDYLHHDSFRLQTYGMTLDSQIDCTFAPSVADEWQGCGIGNALFHFILSDLKCQQFKRIILWGGVQTDNSNAINFYKKNGFKTLGQFTYNGENNDMVLEIFPAQLS